MNVRRVWVWCAFALATTMAAGLVGCAKTTVGTPAAPRVGCVAGFDCVTADALTSAQAAIEQAKIGTPANAKTIVNTAIQAYNVAESAYVVYHALVCGSGSVCTVNVTPAITAQATTMQADVQAKVSTVQTAVAQLGGSK